MTVDDETFGSLICGHLLEVEEPNTAAAACDGRSEHRRRVEAAAATRQLKPASAPTSHSVAYRQVPS